MNFDKYVFLTGGTGLLGQYLLRDLLIQGHKVAVLIRGNRKLSANARVEQVMQHWERETNTSLPRPVVLAGDINQPNLGLSAEDQRWVRLQCDRMLHCAASLQFTAHKGEPWRTNVEGTRNVVNFCLAVGLDVMHYISTAYVCGRRTGVVKEDELDVGQEFRNDYEKSKFEAEKIVRESTAFRELTIYRPVVIAGDSETGYTSTYHGAYLYMKLAEVLANNIEPDANGYRHVPVRWGAKADVKRNITTVDWNSAIICKIFNNPLAHGRTFHLAPVEPIVMREIIEFAAEYYKLTGIEFLGYADRPDFVLSELERRLWANVSIYGSYDFMDPTFDMTNLQAFAAEPVSPRLDHDTALRLIDFAQKDRWGKGPRPELVTPEVSAEDFLQGLIAWDEPSPFEPDQSIGLNVFGPGGGPFQLDFAGGRLIAVHRGLPHHESPLVALHLTHEQLLRIRDEAESETEAMRVLGELLGMDGNTTTSSGPGDETPSLAHPQPSRS
jgi:thioester reductase-like protein